jgi:transmembrane 9 superfamily protein 3
MEVILLSLHLIFIIWASDYALFLCSWQVYYVYGFMLLVFVILLIVTICVTIVGTYFLLNAENYHWQWTSFFSAASTALYVYLYSIYYYHVKTKMSGFFQTSFYFGYTMMFCLGLGILCGNFLLLLNDWCIALFKISLMSWHLFWWLRCYWLSRVNSFCEENLQKHQMWLNSRCIWMEGVVVSDQICHCRGNEASEMDKC